MSSFLPRGFPGNIALDDQGVSAIATTADNPLDAPQRETVGAGTFAKYEYQYHWALARALEEHKTNIDYVVLVEHHEDVVLVKPASLANPAAARFFFHQVKNVAGKPWTAKDLTKRKKVSEKLGNSVLGKLVQGTHGKPFTPQLEAILIVATCGFSLPQQKPDQKYQELQHENLSPEVQQQLKEAVEEELGHEIDISRLRLLKPSLGVNYVADVVSAIVDLVHMKMPGARTNARYIYQGLIDELHRRGVIPHDYQSWEKLLQEKALTGSEIEKTLSIHSSTPHGDALDAHIGEIGSKLGLPLTERIKLGANASAYYRRKKFTTSLDQMRVNDELKSVVDKNWHFVQEEKLPEFASAVKQALTAETAQHLESLHGLNAAIACEIILRSIGD